MYLGKDKKSRRRNWDLVSETKTKREERMQTSAFPLCYPTSMNLIICKNDKMEFPFYCSTYVQLLVG